MIPQNTNLKLITWLLFLLALIPTAYSFGPSLSNQHARLLPIYAVVERDPKLPLFSIDNYMFQKDSYVGTIDWSINAGHYYSNKSPGGILLGIPPYYFAYKIEKYLGLNPDQPKLAYLNAYLINFFVSVIPFALSAIAFFHLLLTYKSTTRLAGLLTIIYIFATPFIPYNQTMWGTNTTTSFIVIALYYLRKESYQAILAGVFLGLALQMDYLAFLAVGSIFIYEIFLSRKKIIPSITSFSAILSVMFYYQYLCFGSIFKTAKTNENPAFAGTDLLFGVFSLPSPEIIWALLFSLQKGMILFMPIFFCSLIGLCFWAKRNWSDPLLWLCIFNILGYLLFVASFNGWHGGATTFPRYLLPALVFWIIPLKECSRILRAPVILLSLFSAFNSLVLSAISPISPDLDRNPLYGFCYHLFFNGRIAPIKYPIRLQGLDPNFASYQNLSSGNIGQLLGLNGLPSLIPLLIIIGLLTFFLLKSINQRV